MRDLEHPVAPDGETVVSGTEYLNAGHHGVQFYGQDQEQRRFAFCRDAPAAARHFAVDALQRWGAGDLADDAALVVTELAANAVIHARSGFTLALSARTDTVRISVRDASPLLAEPGRALPAAPLHGLGAVDALASQWGVESLGRAGKTVWVELRR
jgi:hypothetical protein